MEDLRIYIDKIKQICVEKKVIILLLILFLSIIGVCSLFNNNDDNLDLYKVYSNGQYIFIDEQGNEILKLPEDKYDYVGEFREGRLFVAKKTIDNLGSGQYEYAIVKLYVLNKKGEIIREIKQKGKSILCIISDGETYLNYLPEYYNGYAIIHFVEDKKFFNKHIDYEKLKLCDIYINKKGIIVRTYIDSITKKILDDKKLSYSRFKPDKDIIFKEFDNQNIGYINNKGNIIIKPIFVNDTHCGDFFTYNPQFYNGIAVVHVYNNNLYNDGYYYINKKGEFLNKEPYELACPFYGNLAAVMTKTKRGYINRQGNLVWSESLINKVDEENFDYESIKDSKLNDTKDLYDNANYSREQMKQGYEFAKNIKNIVKRKDINTFADYVNFPINICEKDISIRIENKEQLLNFGKDRLFTNDFVNNIITEELFVKAEGFMLGHGEIWFGY